MLPNCIHSQVESVVLTLLLPSWQWSYVLERRDRCWEMNHIYGTHPPLSLVIRVHQSFQDRMQKGTLLSHGRTPGISFRHCLWITLETESHAVTLSLMQSLQIHWETLSASFMWRCKEVLVIDIMPLAMKLPSAVFTFIITLALFSSSEEDMPLT